jgi:glucose-1-phosphate adenylyltransferase
VQVFGIVLAGGEGKRLSPLTADRAKPAVPFGGNYRRCRRCSATT